MAELPRYRPLGVSIGSMPSVNFIQTGAAEAQVYDNISKGLNAISEFVYERAVAEAEIAAVKYGAEIAPSVKQLEEASRTGVTLDPDLPDGLTIFDQKARKTAIDVMQTNMEIAARNEISALSIEAKDSDMTADEFQLQLNGIIDGYSSALGQVNPIAAVNLQASITPVANSKLITHANAMATKAEAQEKVAVSFGVDTIINDVPDNVAAGNRVAADGTVTTIDDFLNLERQRIYALAYGIEDEAFLSRRLEEFDKAVMEAKGQYVVDWIRDSDSPLDAMIQLTNGDIEDENVAILVSQMSPEQAEFAFGKALSALSDEQSVIAANDARDEKARKEKVDGIKADIIDARIAGDPDAELGFIESLREIDEDLYSTELTVFYSGKNIIDNPDTVSLLDGMAARGQLTEGMIVQQVTDRDLSTETARTYYTILRSQRDSSHNKAMQLIRSEFNVTTEGFDYAAMLRGDDNAESNSNNQKVIQAELELIEAKKANADLDAIAWARAFIKDSRGTAKVELAEGAGLRIFGDEYNKLTNFLKKSGVDPEDKVQVLLALDRAQGKGEINAIEYSNLFNMYNVAGGK
jgi:hypothetical protein